MNAKENIAHAFHLPLFIPSKHCDKSSDLEDIIEEDSNRCLTAERLQRRNIRERPNQERENFRHSRSRNRRSDFSHSTSDSRAQIFPRTVLHSSTDNEHVVDTDSQNQERNNFSLIKSID